MADMTRRVSNSSSNSTTCCFLARHADHALGLSVAPGPCGVSFFCHQWLAHGHECDCHACCQVIYLVCRGQSAACECLWPCACCYCEGLDHALRFVWQPPSHQCIACFCLVPVAEICVVVEGKGTACFCDHLAYHACHAVVVSVPFLCLF